MAGHWSNYMLGRCKQDRKYKRGKKAGQAVMVFYFTDKQIGCPLVRTGKCGLLCTAFYYEIKT